MNGDTLEKYYQEGPEERIIACIADDENISFEKAMDIYYNSITTAKRLNGSIRENTVCSISIIRYLHRF